MFGRISKITLVLILLVLGLAAYLFATGFNIFRRAGYNPPVITVTPTSVSGQGELDFLTLPDNLSISVFAEDLERPRVIAFDPAGRMLVSETKAGRVVLLKDADKDGKAESKTVVLDNLKQPHGLAFYTDPKTKTVYLYVAETHQVARFPYDVNNGKVLNANGQNIANLPAGGGHFSRTIAFGPNYRTSQIIGGVNQVNTLGKDKLYISVGSSCDVCVEDTWKRAAILESDSTGSYTAEFAGGLRNSVFFTFHPETKEIWATEMGRDNLGDNLPPDEVNIVKVAGPDHKYGARRYGWPFCYGNQVKDTKFNPDKVARIDIPTDCSQTEPPAIEIPAHSAPLGLAFISDKKWPSEWRNDLLVAYHGSWNRSEPTGYKIVKFKVENNGKVSRVEDFITGWLNDDNKVLGRPVDLKFGPDDALYVSDDAAGIIYRVMPR